MYILTNAFGKGLAASPYACRCATDYPSKRVLVLSTITTLYGDFFFILHSTWLCARLVLNVYPAFWRGSDGWHNEGP